MAKESSLTPMSNLIFDTSGIFIPHISEIKDFESKSDKNLSKTSEIYLHCQELGNAITFTKMNMIRSQDILLELPIPDIISAEKTNQKKRIGQKWFCIIKTAGDTISIQSKEDNVDTLVDCINGLKDKEELMKKSTDITFMRNGSPETISINPYSPSKYDGEETIYELNNQGAIYWIVTNYRAYQNTLFGGTNPKYVQIGSLTHAEYDSVIASNVQNRTNTTTQSKSESRPQLWAIVANERDFQTTTGVESSSSIESQTGNIEFMKEGKQVMIWKNIPDPVALVEKIKAAKSSFSEAVPTPQSVDDDPIKALKMRFVKGEISKEEFEEMKSMLE